MEWGRTSLSLPNSPSYHLPATHGHVGPAMAKKQTSNQCIDGRKHKCSSQLESTNLKSYQRL